MSEEESEPVDIIRRCVRGMATKPDEVELKLSGNTIVVRVAAEDASRVLGPQGRTARALRNILTSVCATQGVRYALDLPK